LIKAVVDSNVFVQHFSRIVARIKCDRGLYRFIEAADWLSAILLTVNETQKTSIERRESYIDGTPRIKAYFFKVAQFALRIYKAICVFAICALKK